MDVLLEDPWDHHRQKTQRWREAVPPHLLIEYRPVEAEAKIMPGGGGAKTGPRLRQIQRFSSHNHFLLSDFVHSNCKHTRASMKLDVAAGHEM